MVVTLMVIVVVTFYCLVVADVVTPNVAYCPVVTLGLLRVVSLYYLVVTLTVASLYYLVMNP